MDIIIILFNTQWFYPTVNWVAQYFITNFHQFINYDQSLVKFLVIIQLNGDCIFKQHLEYYLITLA